MRRGHHHDVVIQKMVLYKLLAAISLIGLGTLFENYSGQRLFIFSIGGTLYLVIQMLRHSSVRKYMWPLLSAEILAISIMAFSSKFAVNYAIHILFIFTVIDIALNLDSWRSKGTAAVAAATASWGFVYQIWHVRSLGVVSEGIFFMISLTAIYFLGHFMKQSQREKEVKDTLYDELLGVYRQLKSSADQLEELTAAKERSRMASNLHDALGHSLTSLIMQIEMAEMQLEENPQETKRLLADAKQSARDNLTEVRRVVESVRRGNTDLQQLVDTFMEKTGIVSTLHLDFPCTRLTSDLCQIVYRTVQESLTNAARHTDTKHVWVHLSKDGDVRIKLSIRDDGGVPEVIMPIVEGYGIKTMRERVESIGGHLFYAFHSEESGGFEVVAEFPVMLEGNG